MKKIGNISKFSLLKALILSVFVLCAFSLNLMAQVDVRADVNTTTVTLQEEIKLTVYVNAPSTKIDTPQMPSLPNFNIYSAGQSRRINMINGKVSASMQFNYILTPRFAGKTTIGAFTVKVNGQTYSTEPIEVEITRDAPSAPRTQAQEMEQSQNQVRDRNAQLEANGYNPNAKLPSFFMTAETNTKKAYINEQVTLKIRFYQSQNILGQPLYDKPQLKGLFAEDLATRQGQERFGNKTYYYTEIESALFGLVSGVAEIGSASVTYTSAEGFFDAFDVFFKGANGGRTNKVESDILFVDILPLPSKDKPASFYGAVGTNFSVFASLDMAQVSAGEPITLTITV
ncbi:MAG: BatD family protein, partial [Elusimicrobiaceae bacterium]|nr:BatD family protein [Elusimicrobiaceae bacterium]